jgi:tRNA (Thr-GGU) A37 N-methylase
LSRVFETRVNELDAVDETPVLDVKPYRKGFAPRGELREPAWANELWIFL